ncbi:MAG: HAD hydrolase family protein, partial [Blautia sp.]
EQNLQKNQIAYVGDDLNDLYAMRLAGISACPADGAEEIKAQCDYVLDAPGGGGVVREFVELLLKGRGQWETAIERAFGE